MQEPKRLTKSRKDKQVWGVCGGLGKYLNIDSTLVRLVFVVLALSGGPGVILYIILGIVLPDESDDEEYYEVEKPKNEEIV